MNPWIDVFGWALVIACLIFLRYEIPRAAREIRKIFREQRAVEAHVLRQSGCPTCGYRTLDRFWQRCPSCGSNHQPQQGA
jgi:predicted Zn-ribbon and HTH transcriptional regulator